MRRKLLKADVARGLGVSKTRVDQLAKQGMPVHDLAAAKAWRDEHCDPDRVKPLPGGMVAAAPADATIAELKVRLLLAEVLLKEAKAENSGGISLPSVLVERGLLVGLQLLRASTGNATSEMHGSMVQLIGEESARKVFDMIDRWWAGVYTVASDAILLGFQRELPGWGVDFRERWVTRLRGNFPDQPRPGEPRAIADVPPFPAGDA